MEGVNEEDLKDPVLFQVGFLNTVPFPKQEAVLRSKAKHKVLCCGRRGGKTRLIAGEILRGALLKMYPRQLVTTPVYRNIKPIFTKITEYLRDNILLFDVDKIITSPPQKVTFRNGCCIDFGSLDNPHNLRGEAYDRIFRDESGFEKEDADAVLRPMMFDTDADTWKTSTPWKKNKFFEDFNQGLKGDGITESFHWTSLDNPHLKREVIEEEINRYGENSFYVQSEIFGNFIDDVDSYFKHDLIDGCIDEEYEMIEENKLLVCNG